MEFLYFTRTSIEYTWVELLLVGAIWVVLTVGFAFVVGYFEGIPVEATLAQFSVLAGQVWIFVPFTRFVAPPVFGWYVRDRR